MLRILEKSIPKAKKSMKNRPRKLQNRCLEEVWELLGATLGRKMSKRLSWPIWPDFGQARDAQNDDKIAELGAKMGPRWRQDVQDEACLAISRPIGE